MYQVLRMKGTMHPKEYLTHAQFFQHLCPANLSHLCHSEAGLELGNIQDSWNIYDLILYFRLNIPLFL
jgi:hypothetical protein